MQFEQDLLDIGIDAQMSDLLRQINCLVQGQLPGLDHRHQRIADRAGPVVELDRGRAHGAGAGGGGRGQ